MHGVESYLSIYPPTASSTDSQCHDAPGYRRGVAPHALVASSSDSAMTSPFYLRHRRMFHDGRVPNGLGSHYSTSVDIYPLVEDHTTRPVPAMVTHGDAAVITSAIQDLAYEGCYIKNDSRITLDSPVSSPSTSLVPDLPATRSTYVVNRPNVIDGCRMEGLGDRNET